MLGFRFVCMDMLNSSRIRTILLLAAPLIFLTLLFHLWLYTYLLNPISEQSQLSQTSWLSDSKPECSSDGLSNDLSKDLGKGCSIASELDTVQVIGQLPSVQSNQFITLMEIDIQPGEGDSTLIELEQSQTNIVLVPVVEGQRRWDLPHHFFRKHWDETWEASARLYYDHSIDGFQLVIDRQAGSESIQIKSLSIRQYQTTSWHSLWMVGLSLFWVILLILIAKSLVGKSGKNNILLLAVFFAIVLGTQVPNGLFSPLQHLMNHAISFPEAAQKPEKGGYVQINSRELQKYSQAQDKPTNLTLLKKLGHVSLFIALTILLWFRFDLTSQRSKIFLTALFIAVLTEVAQGIGATRSPSFMDVGIDTVGILFGLLIIAFLQKTVRFNRLFSS